MDAKTYPTNFLNAVNWLNNSYILCNKIADLDYQLFDKTVNVPKIESDDTEENGEYNYDIYQFFLTDCSDKDVEFLAKHFDLSFAYSELLDCWVLLIYHVWISWDYVYCETDLEMATASLGQILKK